MSRKAMGTFTAIVLALAAGTLILTSSDLDNMYVCPLTSEVYVFKAGISGGMGSLGYPETRGVDGVYCQLGRVRAGWEKFCDVAAREGYDCNKFTQEMLTSSLCPVIVCDQSAVCVCTEVVR